MGKPGLSFVTALELSCSRLWIGTANGIVISVPLTLGKKIVAAVSVYK